MSLGSAYLKFRQKYQHGLKTVWYRDFVRESILKSKPFVQTTSDVCEIHTLTSKDDYLNLIWTLKSFYFYSERSYALCIHSDGTLDEAAIALLQFHFPKARVILKEKADNEVTKSLTNNLHALKFRTTNHLAPKLFDFKYYLQSDRMLLMDSDILFFSAPVELIHRIEDPKYRKNTVNKDAMYGYTLQPEEVKTQFGFDLIPFFNSGLGLIHKDSINIDWIEEFLTAPNILGHFWRIEQTLFALCSSKFGVELLPKEYDVQLEKGIKGLPSRHYVGKIRHLMYAEGIQQLQQQRFLENISR